MSESRPLRWSLTIALCAVAACSPSAPAASPIQTSRASIRTAVPVGPYSLSAVITRPGQAGAASAVLLLQGLDCAPLDPPTGVSASYLALLNVLDGAGLVTMRVDKRGVGTSGGAACADESLAEEVEGYRAALRVLREQPFVRPQSVYLLGHSVGGLIAPLLAHEPGVAGLVVYGADPTPWRQYELTNARRQWQWQGWPRHAIDARLARWADFQAALYDQHVAPLEARRRFPEFASVIDDRGRYQGHAFGYVQELAALDAERAWRGVTVPVLVVAGDADAMSTAADQARIVALVEPSRPGLASMVTVSCADHWFRRVCSQAESLSWAWAGPFQPEVGKVIVRWLGERGAARGK